MRVGVAKAWRPSYVVKVELLRHVVGRDWCRWPVRGELLVRVLSVRTVIGNLSVELGVDRADDVRVRGCIRQGCAGLVRE